MSVVVTGAAGFIGSHLVARLLRDGFSVVGIDRQGGIPPGATALHNDLSRPSNVVKAALREADAVFHLAGCPGVRTQGADIAERRLRDNVLAGDNVLRLTPPTTPVIVVSSSSVYGGTRPGPHGGRASAESDLPQPLGGYARSKVALEERCAVRATSGGHVVVLRPFTVAGENQRADMALAQWMDAAIDGEPLRILGSADRRRDVTDVRDVVEACVRAAQREATGIINVGTGVGWRLRDLADAVRRALDIDVTMAVEPVSDVEPSFTRADTRRCRRVLGFTPVTELDALVRRQAAARLIARDLPVSVEIT